MKKIVWPSLANKNKLTIYCKLFGCENKYLMTLYDRSEMHGLNLFGKYTAAKTTIRNEVYGCGYCKNYNVIIGEDEIDFPYSICDCQTCITLQPELNQNEQDRASKLNNN